MPHKAMQVLECHSDGRLLPRWLASFIAAIALLSGASLLAQQPENRQSHTTASTSTPCMSGARGEGSEEQQMCLGELIPGFGGYYYDGPCKMVFYLIDPKEADEALKLMERFSHAMLPECGKQISVQIKKGTYKFSDLYSWRNRFLTSILMNKEQNITGFLSLSILTYQNRIHVYMENDQAVSNLKDALLDDGFDLGAFVFGSRESEAKALAAIPVAPTITADKQVAVPIFKMGGNVLGALVMGKASESEALKVAPAFQGYGPHKPGKITAVFSSDEARKVTDKVRRIYNPAFTKTILGFDGHKKLVFVEYLIDEARSKRLTDEIDALTEMREIHRTAKAIIKQGWLTPCVVVQTNTRILDGVESTLQHVEFLYTCKAR